MFGINKNRYENSKTINGIIGNLVSYLLLIKNSNKCHNNIWYMSVSEFRVKKESDVGPQPNFVFFKTCLNCIS